MEQQRFPVEDGAVTCRPVGDRLEVQAALPGPGEGLYRAYLRGESGKQLDLGTLLPQGNGRRLQRSLPIAELKRRGCWPVTGAGVTLSYAFERPQGMNQPPKGWHKSEQAAARFPNDPVLAQAVRAAGSCLLCQRADGTFRLAWGWEPRKAFPLPPVFCFGKVEKVGGRVCVVWTFSGEGRPVVSGGAG